MTYDYQTILGIYKGEIDPGKLNPQVLDRIRRVATSDRLAMTDKDDLPRSLSALIELIKLPEKRFQLLERNGMLGPDMTAEQIREVRDVNPVTGFMSFYLYDDDRLELGPTVPIGSLKHRGY